jgi:membrane-bound metal-dependent hydrolase YbcI (DUF457 family)
MVKRDMPSPFGHAIAGAAAAWCVDFLPGGREWRTAPAHAPLLQRAGGMTTAVCAGLAVLPDIDLLFDAHRSVTHSVTAVFFVTIIAAAVTGWVTDRPAWRIALMCGSAYGTHLVLDWLAVDRYFPYGLQVFWPFSATWYISGLNLFPQTERYGLFTLRALWINLDAFLWEAIFLVPVATLVWLIRVKALAGLAPQLSSRHHAPEQGTRPIL